MEIVTALKVFSFIVLVLSVVLHEVAHGYAALAQGDLTAKYAGRLTLNPLRHIDLFGSIIFPIITSMMGVGFGWAKPVPFNPDNLRNKRWGEAIVAAAGPLTNILIAVVFACIVRVGVETGSLGPIGTMLAAMVILVNITLAVFNLVPIPPLDGSKILFAIIPRRSLSIRRFMERYQLVLVLLYIFVLWKFFSPVIVYLFIALIGTDVSSTFLNAFLLL